jgi:hypothetical protein
MWEPRRLTTLWASKACYRDKFTFLPFWVWYTIHGNFALSILRLRCAVARSSSARRHCPRSQFTRGKEPVSITVLYVLRCAILRIGYHCRHSTTSAQKQYTKCMSTYSCVNVLGILTGTALQHYSRLRACALQQFRLDPLALN